MARRDYSDEEKAACLAALAANGGNLSQAARQCGVPRNTLRRWVEEQQKAPPVAPAATEKKGGCDTPAVLVPVVSGKLADKLEAIAHQIAGVLPGKIESANLSQLSVSLGILIEKMRLLREQATDIHRTEGLTDDERVERIDAIYARVAARLGSTPVPRGEG